MASPSDNSAPTAPGPAAAPRVDAAVHVWSADPAAYPWSPLDGVELPAAGAEAEQLLETLGSWDFDAAVCVQPRVYGHDHAYLEAALAANPGRVAGVCLIDPGAADAVARLERHVREGGMRGVRVIALGEDDRTWLAGETGDTIWEACAELGVPVSVLVSPPGLGAVRAQAERSPATTTVIDHLGLVTPDLGAEALRALLGCAEAPNLWVKVSALNALSAEPWPYSDLEPLVRAAVDAFGPERIVFGTDWPYALDHGPWQDQRLALAEAWGLDGAGYDGLFGVNAARLWKLEPAAAAKGELL